MEYVFKTFLGQNALSIDLINIAPLDDLHQPTGVIDEAQRMAANAFEVDNTLFSVQATSSAIIRATCISQFICNHLSWSQACICHS